MYCKTSNKPNEYYNHFTVLKFISVYVYLHRKHVQPLSLHVNTFRQSGTNMEIYKILRIRGTTKYKHFYAPILFDEC